MLFGDDHVDQTFGQGSAGKLACVTESLASPGMPMMVESWQAQLHLSFLVVLAGVT